MHCDFSIFNILWVKEGDAWIGKLPDFEFVNKVNSELSHDVQMVGLLKFYTVHLQ